MRRHRIRGSSRAGGSPRTWPSVRRDPRARATRVSAVRPSPALSTAACVMKAVGRSALHRSLPDSGVRVSLPQSSWVGDAVVYGLVA
jgi:hypothetical protein